MEVPGEHLCKKIVTAILAVGIVAATSAEVWYVPGWNRTAETNGLAYTSCTNVFKGNVCAFWGWDGDRSWSTSAANADVAAKRLAAEIAATNAAFRSELVIVGHSLGGRIVSRSLALLGRRGLKVKQGIVLAGAEQGLHSSAQQYPEFVRVSTKNRR